MQNYSKGARGLLV